MKILIYNPSFGKGFVRCARSAFRTAGRVQRHPDYLLYATAVLEKEGYECKFIDAAALNLPNSALKEAALRLKPDLAVIHTTTPSIYNDVKCAEVVKEVKRDCITILVGTHASALPVETLRLSTAIDIVARGEFDYTLRDIAKAIEGHMELNDVLGITFRKGDEIVSTANRPFIENLDEIPFPAWHHINPYWYFDPVKKFPFLTSISGRGCPFHCSFCVLPQVLMGQKYRLRSPKNVVDEIEHDLSSFPYLKGIMFEDDTMLVNKKRCRDICLEILERGIDIWWGCNVRADVTDLDLLKLMRKAGCQLFVVGYESGVQEILNNVNKGIKIQAAKEFTKLAKKAGIHVHGCFIIGLPGETRETALQTLSYIKELRPDSIQVYAATPYPGTKFYDWARKEGFIVAEDWDDYVSDEGEQTCIISYPHFSKDEILYFVNKAYKDFYLQPLTALRLLLRVKDINDLQRFTKGLANFLDYWLTFGRKTKAK
jgi:radical SAM superfamily enzyme YgiQ (UPF0313 family)